MSDLDTARTRLCGYSGTPKILLDATEAKGKPWDISIDIRLILSALTEAEQERDAAIKQRDDIDVERWNEQARANRAESRIQELEAWQSKALPYLQAEYSTYIYAADCLCAEDAVRENLDELAGLLKEAKIESTQL